MHSYGDEDDKAHGNVNRGEARMQMTKAMGKARMHKWENPEHGHGPCANDDHADEDGHEAREERH